MDIKNLNPLRAVIAFMTIAIMGSIFLIFYQNQNYIIQSGQFYSFLVMTVLAALFLLALIYLISKPVKEVKYINKKISRSHARSKKKK